MNDEAKIVPDQFFFRRRVSVSGKMKVVLFFLRRKRLWKGVFLSDRAGKKDNFSDILLCKKEIKNGFETYFQREVFFQSMLKFPYINPITYAEFGNNYIIYTQAQPFGSLFEISQLDIYSPLFFTDLMGIIYKISLTIQYYFERDIIHRDIKPHNIFISDDLEPLLSDFGIARSTDSHNTKTINTGTANFKSPLVSSG